MSLITIRIEDKYYTKDPQSSELGRKIVSSSIEMLNELGYERFTFKKLATEIGSTEASVYRYFENKHKLLVYLITWYWAWIEYVIDYRTHHIDDPKTRLEAIIDIICHADSSVKELEVPGIDMTALRGVVVVESDKTYLIKQVDEINNQGLFMGYKALCHKISLLISALDRGYAYPHAIVSTILEASHQQTFFAEHLPRLTEISNDNSQSTEAQTSAFIKDLISRLLA